MRKYSLEAFLEACGADRPLMLEVSRAGDEASQRLALHQPFAVIGRAADADVPLRDASVKPQHAYLQVIAGRVFCVNFGSFSRQAGEDIGEGADWLNEKQALHVGAHRVCVFREVSSDPAAGLVEINPLTSGSATRLGMPSLTLECFRDRSVRFRWCMNRLLLLLGSSPYCKVRMGSDEAAPFHCSLVSTPHGAWVLDLAGHGGITLNGVQVRQAHVEDGDLLQVGGVSIRLRYDDVKFLETYPSGQLTSLAPEHCPSGSAALSAPAVSDSAATPSAGPFAPLLSPPAGQGQALVLPAGAQDEPLAALALPMLNHFNLMQQQMFDQFQQALLQMFQMFGALHKDQMGFLREELDRQRQVTEELRGLQIELAKLQSGAPAAHAQRATASSRQEKIPANGTVHPAVPAQATAPAENVSGRKEGPVPAPAEKKPAAAANGSQSSNGQGKMKSASGPENPGPDVHAWLCQRMANLEQERQTGWQRLLNLLSGRGKGGSAS